MSKPMIPSMGGRELGPVFARYIDAMPFGLDVVEVGAWLGAGTYELATAMQDHGHVGDGKNQSSLHVYDRFIADKGQVVKAAGKHRYPAGITVDGRGDVLKLKVGMDTLPTVRGFLHPFKFVKFYKGELGGMSYKKGKGIGVLVVDALKRDPHFTKLMKKLEPHLVPGAVIFLMDFYYYKKVKGSGTECQGAYVKKSGKYTLLESLPNLACAVFRYEG